MNVICIQNICNGLAVSEVITVMRNVIFRGKEKGLFLTNASNSSSNILRFLIFVQHLVCVHYMSVLYEIT